MLAVVTYTPPWCALSVSLVVSVSKKLLQRSALSLEQTAQASIIYGFWIMCSSERTARQGVLDNKELHKCTSPQTTVTVCEMKGKYPWGALHYVLLFPVWLHSFPSTSAERSEHVPLLERWDDKAQTWCLCTHTHAIFNTSHRNQRES